MFILQTIWKKKKILIIYELIILLLLGSESKFIAIAELI